MRKNFACKWAVGLRLEHYRYMYRGQRHTLRLRTPFHRTGRADIRRFLVQDIQALQAYLSVELASTTLADLFALRFAANPFFAARASLRRWSSDEFEDGLTHGGQCRSRRWPVDSFFPALPF